MDSWRGRIQSALEGVPSPPPSQSHPAWLRLITQAAGRRRLLPDWPLRGGDEDDDRYRWRVPHNLYSAGHLPFQLPGGRSFLPEERCGFSINSAAEPCPGTLQRCLLAAAGETLRLLQPAGEAAPAVGYTAVEWEHHAAGLRARYGPRAAREPVVRPSVHGLVRRGERGRGAMRPSRMRLRVRLAAVPARRPAHHHVA